MRILGKKHLKLKSEYVIPPVLSRTLLKLTILKIFSGVYSGEATHVPFPNTVVKSSSGDGTAHMRVGE